MSSTNQPVNIPKRSDGWAPRDISVTPGGQHLFAVTPGGSKIIWSREAMMNLAASPLSMSPLDLPEDLAFLSKGATGDFPLDNHKPKPEKSIPVDDGLPFQMDS